MNRYQEFQKNIEKLPGVIIDYKKAREYDSLALRLENAVRICISARSAGVIHRLWITRGPRFPHVHGLDEFLFKK